MEINKAICDSFIDGYNRGKEDLLARAYEWLQCIDFEVDYFTNDNDGYTFFNADKFIEDFRKAIDK